MLEKVELSSTVDGDVIGVANSGHHYVKSSKSKIYLPYDPAIPFLGKCSKDLTFYLTETCLALYIASYLQ